MRKILVLNSKGGCGKTTLATNLASHFASLGQRVALADADKQKSSLGWIKRRDKAIKAAPGTLAPIAGLNWSKSGRLGLDKTSGVDTVVIDGPGGLRSEQAKALIAEAAEIVVPVLPSVFDWEATFRFLSLISEIKRVRKGKAEIHIVANRMIRKSAQQIIMEEKFAREGHPVLCRLADRALYSKLAVEGAGLFDRRDAPSRNLRIQWTPLLQAID
ncbi:AAA family ATPase [Roseibium sp.]|uniref:AAA family ATPase n=1 Tax=Roseibium sp. TaxID=1936156 RepID=UPI003A97E176